MVLAIFDVDQTVIRGDSLLWFGAFLLKKRWLKIREVPRFIALSLRYLSGSADEGKLKASYLRMLCGEIRINEMNLLAEEFSNKFLLPRTYQQARDRIRWHQQQQHAVVLLSASPATYLNAFAKTLEVDALIATQIEWRDGSLTGDLQGKNCKGKEKLERLRSAYGNSQVNWKESYYYADSIADLPVFDTVGHPVLVNPDGKLQRVGFKRQWRVERWS